MSDLIERIHKIRLQAQLSPLGGATCDARLLLDVLDEVEEILGAEPSKALECLGTLEIYFYNKWKSSYFLEDKPKELNSINIIKQTLIKAQAQDEALKIILEEPYQCAPTILYIDINKNNPKMLNYEHYVMSVKAPLSEEDFERLVRYITNGKNKD